MEKTFTVAGYSTHNGVTKFRVANSLDRVAVLERAGHTNIFLQEFPTPQTKEALQALYPDFVPSATVPAKKAAVEGEIGLRIREGSLVKVKNIEGPVMIECISLHHTAQRMAVDYFGDEGGSWAFQDDIEQVVKY